jgi:hypothetical protein
MQETRLDPDSHFWKTPPRFVGLSHTRNVLVEKDVEKLPRVIEGLKGAPSVPGFGNICDEIKRCK